MAEPVVHVLEVVEVTEDERRRLARARGPRELVGERVQELAPVRERRQLVRDGLLLHELMEVCVLESDRRLCRDPFRRLARVLGERALACSEQHRQRRSVEGVVEVDPHLVAGRAVAALVDLLPTAKQCTAGGVRRLDRRLEHHRQERARVVRRRERLPDERDRVAHGTPGCDHARRPPLPVDERGCECEQPDGEQREGREATPRLGAAGDVGRRTGVEQRPLYLA